MHPPSWEVLAFRQAAISAGQRPALERSFAARGTRIAEIRNAGGPSAQRNPSRFASQWHYNRRSEGISVAARSAGWIARTRCDPAHAERPVSPLSVRAGQARPPLVARRFRRGGCMAIAATGTRRAQTAHPHQRHTTSHGQIARPPQPERYKLQSADTATVTQQPSSTPDLAWHADTNRIRSSTPTQTRSMNPTPRLHQSQGPPQPA